MAVWRCIAQELPLSWSDFLSMTPRMVERMLAAARGEVDEGALAEDAWGSGGDLATAIRRKARLDNLTEEEYQAFERRSAEAKLVIRDGSDEEWGLFAAGLGV